MGMEIDNSCERKSMSKEEIVDTLKTMVFGVQALERFNAKERETLDKAWNLIDQYEQRLKADMVAMLTELQLEIEELPTNRIAITDSSGLICYGYKEYKPTAEVASKIIQQKIDELKEQEDGNDDRNTGCICTKTSKYN